MSDDARQIVARSDSAQTVRWRCARSPSTALVRSFVCGRYWDDSWCQKDVQVIPAAERQKLFNTKGSCLAWRNLTSGQEFVQGPNEKMRIAGSIAKAASEAAKKEASKHSKGRRR